MIFSLNVVIWRSDHTLSSQDDNKWHVAMFLKFVNVTKLQFLFPWQVSWHSLTDEIFINVFTTASPDGLQRKELKTHWVGGADELILVFSVFSWHRTWCDPKTIVTNKRNGNMLGLIWTGLHHCPQRNWSRKINNKIEEIREKFDYYFIRSQGS